MGSLQLNKMLFGTCVKCQWQSHGNSTIYHCLKIASCHLHVVAISISKEQHGKHQDGDEVQRYCAPVCYDLT